jgi:hypothetical protein
LDTAGNMNRFIGALGNLNIYTGFCLPHAVPPGPTALIARMGNSA